jgi:alpha-N-arabinofuranosidase
VKASVSLDGSVNVTLVNTAPDAPAEIEMRVDGAFADVEEARILTGDIRAHNEFDAPDEVAPVPFSAVASEFDKTGTELKLTLPPCAVVSLRLR